MKKVFSLMLILMLVLSLAAPAMAAPKVKTTITLSHSGTVTMNLGQQLQLTATVSPEAPVTWKSSRAKSVAVNASGLVTASAEGTATITAKAGGKSAKVKIKVIDPDKPNKVYIAQGKALTAYVGTPVALGVGYEPTTAKATLTWKTSKAKVAAVDGNGVLTPIAEGKAKITVTTHNRKKATIAVTVVDPNKPTKVSFQQGASAGLVAGQSLQLSAVPEPATAQTTLIWKSSNPKVAAVDANGAVTAIKKGKAKITAQANNNKKAKATITINVSAAPEDPAKYDLLGVFGMSGKAAMDKYGAKLVKDGETYFVKGKDNYAFYLEDEKNVNSRVNFIAVGDLAKGKKSLWNIAGVKFGTTVSETSAILGAAGWTTLSPYSASEQDALFAKGNLRLSIDYEKEAAVVVMLYEE